MVEWVKYLGIEIKKDRICRYIESSNIWAYYSPLSMRWTLLLSLDYRRAKPFLLVRLCPPCALLPSHIIFTPQFALTSLVFSLGSVHLINNREVSSFPSSYDKTWTKPFKIQKLFRIFMQMSAFFVISSLIFILKLNLPKVFLSKISKIWEKNLFLGSCTFQVRAIAGHGCVYLLSVHFHLPYDCRGVCLRRESTLRWES